MPLAVDMLVTAPRQVLRGTTYMITRRCSERRFFLRPSETTNGIFLFMLALAARQFGIAVHAYCVLSNHYHLIVTDTDARLPAFMQHLNAFVARAVNASIGHWEHFWSSSSYSAVELVTPEDVVAATAYVLANPVAATLVRKARMWPGAWSDPDLLIGRRSIVVPRPRQFFATDGGMPAVTTLKLTTPPAFDSAADFVRQVNAALEEIEFDTERRVRRRGFLGVAAVLNQRPTARPSSVEPRRNLNPRVAARNPAKRIEALSRRAAFVREYRLAWAARRRGDPNTVFPAGTYLMRVLHGVACAGYG